MDKETRSAIERATQRARKLLEEDFAAQLEGDFDVHRDGAVAANAGGHLSARQAFQRERIVATIEHKRAAGMSAADSVADYLRDAAFTTLNRFVALKMMEARELVQECITKGEQSAGYREFCGLAPGLPLLPDSAGYRLYIESLFDELSTEVKVLFDRRDPSNVLWPKRAIFEQLLEILNATELAGVWGEDETIGWVYQFFNGQDERRKMREESQAPRNSRELAVRNQFFTPRYVVQFLTDNTLGRIWYEMRGTKTALADRCEYMVRKPDEEFAPRSKKDPRDLRVLDPACGSGHFLLYAFDLLFAIYEEAHADPESPKSEATCRTLAEDYPSLDEFRRAVPGLVLAHNLHGVDIDPRCAQIAQLALWMRAQKAYRDFGIGRADRAQIRRSNIVVAEPLIGDEQIVEEFVAKLGDAELGLVFSSLVKSLNLAGDMGLLLRIEQLVGRQVKRGQTDDLFAPPEERIRAALALFVSDERRRANTRRRLFADDAAHGVALLGVAETRFDVVLMNPPFGDGSAKAKKEFEKAYPRTKNDIYAAFVDRGVELLTPRGRLGAITSRTGFFLSSFVSWREGLLKTSPPVVFADLGLGVMDAALVEAAAYCLERSQHSRGERTIFLRVLEELDDKAGALKRAVLLPNTSGTHRWFDIDAATFASVPGSPFAYWVSDSLRDVFRRVPPFESNGRQARQGLATADDFRFVRTWWGVPTHQLGRRWSLFAKGGKYSPFYFDLHLCVKWEDDGRDVRGYEKAFPRNTHLFSRPGLTWPLRTKSELGFRIMPKGCAFGHKGPAAVVEGDREAELLALLALTTSMAFRSLVEFQLAAADAKAGGAARSYEVGVIQRTSVPNLEKPSLTRLASLAKRAWRAKRSLDTTNETSHAFVLPLGLNEKISGLDCGSAEVELGALQQEIDEVAFVEYGISVDDRRSIEASFKRPVSRGEAVDDGDDEDDLRDDSSDASLAGNAASSWLVGCSFGRFDPRLATGERAIPSEPEPFDPLPARSPGMYPEGEEPADRPDILVDDEGHEYDLTARARTIAERIHLDVPENLRGWLAKEFFPLHIKMYSKSRRKAPIYWQLATPSTSYSVWLYIHAFSKDTLFRVQNEYAAPKLAHEERRLESLTNELRDGATAAQRKALAAQAAIVDELRAFIQEVKQVAPLWNPNLDDGVVINFAPLWRLVPQNRAWQKELKSHWDALCEGKYDWAHLAMRLWPERVVPKCAKDRSLAIAHGLEDLFWVEGTDGKWTARKTPARSVDELARERTSPAVKSALTSLVEAPTATGNAGRGRGGRRKAVVEGGNT
ncbi:hypothetical protein OKW40_003529 [Paraburkholderia sp. RAU6.4a]|uniref:BREX-1 system adenine-specific DNA-methyltransferase PglX n=1 Tax=Paraburkholderia sp. RAU6.4a TaxID=2991067 RepID=UPI003D20CA85